MPSTLLKNARLLDPWTHLDQPGDLLAINGLITALGAEAGPAAPEGAVVIECDGHCLAPGLVDMRVGLREPGHEYVESLAISSQAAAAGGITSLVGLPDTDPVLDDIALIEFITRRAAKVGLVNIYAFGAATRGLRGQDLTEMGLMAAAGALGFTDGGRAIADALVMRRALSYARTFDLLVVQHPEEPRLAAGGAATEGEIATRLGLPGTTPAAELIMVERDLRLVEITGGRYHAAHLSTAAAIDAMRKAKRCQSPATPPRPISRSTRRRSANIAASPSCRRRSGARPTGWPWSKASRTARSTPSPPTTSRMTRTPSACPMPRPPAAWSGWRRCCRSPSPSITMAGCRCSRCCAS
jgi:dihydroorotase